MKLEMTTFVMYKCKLDERIFFFIKSNCHMNACGFGCVHISHVHLEFTQVGSCILYKQILVRSFLLKCCSLVSYTYRRGDNEN